MGSGEGERWYLAHWRPRTKAKTNFAWGTTQRLQVLPAEEIPEGKLQVQCAGCWKTPKRHEGSVKGPQCGGPMICQRMREKGTGPES